MPSQEKTTADIIKELKEKNPILASGSVENPLEGILPSPSITPTRVKKTSEPPENPESSQTPTYKK